MTAKSKPHPDVAKEQFIEAAGFGVKGLILRALMHEGGAAPIATFAKIGQGQGFVEVRIRIDAAGIKADGAFCSHNERAALFCHVADADVLRPCRSTVEGEEPLLRAAQVGLHGLAQLAFSKAGETAALEMLDLIENGQAHIAVDVLYSRRGASIEGHFHRGQDTRHLFTVNAQQARQTLH